MIRGAKRIDKAETAQAGPAPEALEGQTRLAAQRIYEERVAKGLPGDEVSDWLAAEAEVRAKRKGR